jgi:D-glycero-D-manno-heptose 1,7-bisphosphate phosphatase
MLKKNKCVFLDRDGTLIKDKHYLNKINKIEFIKNTVKGLKYFQNSGFLLIIISNQSGVAKKIISKKKLEDINKYIIRYLKNKDIIIKKIYNCIHNPEDNCVCRKPKKYFGLKAKKRFNLDFKKSLMIGDKNSDRIFAYNLKLKFFRIGKKNKSINDVYKKYLNKEKENYARL